MDSKYILKVQEYCKSNNIDIKKVRSVDINTALEGMLDSKSKKSYIKSIFHSYDSKEIKEMLTSETTISKMYKNRDIKNRRTFDDVIQVIRDCNVTKISCSSSNRDDIEMGRLLQSVKILYNLFKSQKLPKKEYCDLLKEIFSMITFDTASKFIHYKENDYHKMNIGLYGENDSVKVFLKE